MTNTASVFKLVHFATMVFNVAERLLILASTSNPASALAPNPTLALQYIFFFINFLF